MVVRNAAKAAPLVLALTATLLATPAAAQGTTTDYTITLQENGNSKISIKNTVQLTTEPEKTSFDQLTDDQDAAEPLE